MSGFFFFMITGNYYIIILFNTRYTIIVNCNNNSQKLLLIDSFFFQNLFLESFKSLRSFDLNSARDSWNMFCLSFSDDQRGILAPLLAASGIEISECCDFDGIEGDLRNKLFLF